MEKGWDTDCERPAGCAGRAQGMAAHSVRVVHGHPAQCTCSPCSREGRSQKVVASVQALSSLRYGSSVVAELLS